MKKNWGKLLAIALVLCLVGAFGASMIQSNFGNVEITDVVIRTSAGEYTGYLFVPENAIAEEAKALNKVAACLIVGNYPLALSQSEDKTGASGFL